MKKKLILIFSVFICFLLIYFPTIKVYADANDTNKVRVCVVQTYIYNSPTEFKEENIISTAKYNDVFETLELFEQDNLKVYKIKFNDSFGYIDYYAVVNNNIKSINKVNKPNCKIIGNKNKDIVYLYEIYNNEFIETENIVEIGSKVLADSNFSYNNEYNLVSYYDENNNYIQGYVKTKYLRKDGINLSLILGITITSIAGITGIILLIVFIKKKAKK